jgi:VWFA-related protein
MIGSRLTIALLCAPLALAQPILAQSPVPAAQQPPVITTSSTVVLVPAMVTTTKGEPVFTLAAKDFTLTDDGIAQPLTLEEDSGEEPLALVVAIQTGGGGARQLGKYRNLPLLIETIAGNVPHQIAVVTFDSTPKLRHDFTSDPGPFEQAIHDLSPGDNGAAILDTLGYAVSILKDQPPKYRRAILLISETLDRGSHLKLEDSLREISDTNTAIYSLGFSSIKSEAGRRSGQAFSNDTPGPRHGCMAKDTNTVATTDSDSPTDQAENSASAPSRTAGQVANQAYDCLSLLAPPLALAKMAVIAATNGLQRNVPETVADMTGGEYFQFKDAKSLERDLETISNHVPNRYMLSFHPQSPHPGLHAVTLRLKNYPNLDVSARASYWVDAEREAAAR